MDDATYIIELMKTEREALGFIPSTSIRSYWMKHGYYVLQVDLHGRRRGYILHGPPRPGRQLKIYQACIDYDYRLRGFGYSAVRTVQQRAIHAGATAITLRCAADLNANEFWMQCGFTPIRTEPGGTKRKRLIVTYRQTLTHTESQNKKAAVLEPHSNPISVCLGCPIAIGYQ